LFRHHARRFPSIGARARIGFHALGLQVTQAKIAARDDRTTLTWRFIERAAETCPLLGVGLGREVGLRIPYRGWGWVEVAGAEADMRVLITGATSGLGFAMAEALASAGAAVAVTGRSARQAAEVASGLAGAIGLELDVRDESSVAQAVNEAWSRLGGIDMLVNNAGIGMRTVNPQFMTQPCGFWEVPPDGFRAVINTNLTGYFLMARELTPRMLAAGGGRIVNIAVSESTMVRAGFVPYGPSRAGSEALSRIMAADLRGTTVTVNLLLPGGATDTGMLPQGSRTDGRPFLDPQVMGAPIVWLASDAAADVPLNVPPGPPADLRVPARTCAPNRLDPLKSQADRGPVGNLPDEGRTLKDRYITPDDETVTGLDGAALPGPEAGCAPSTSATWGSCDVSSPGRPAGGTRPDVMRVDEMLDVLDALGRRGVRSWVCGGFGVAVGRVTREHRDLDLLLDASDLADALDCLRGRGYVVETDWLPVRVELARGVDAWVDLHPVVFAPDGSGRQAGPAGTWYDYPAETFTFGSLNGREFPCVSAAAQFRAHAGYELRPKDEHDLAQLRRR
jgi:NAD(P)-dependent dehydrogenase (short-subunit alcohol dehydrogenase family)